MFDKVSNWMFYVTYIHQIRPPTPGGVLLKTVGGNYINSPTAANYTSANGKSERLALNQAWKGSTVSSKPPVKGTSEKTRPVVSAREESKEK